jgi:hypothetical protein
LGSQFWHFVADEQVMQFYGQLKHEAPDKKKRDGQEVQPAILQV